MVDEPVKPPAWRRQRAILRASRPRSVQVLGSLTAADEAGVGVDYEGHVDEARPGAHVGQVGQAERVQRPCPTVPRHEAG